VKNLIKSAILNRIRSKADHASIPNATAVPPEVASATIVREAQLDDFAQVNALNVGLGQGADSFQNWQRLWRDNPALQTGRTPRIGWVLESAGDIVGFLGSIPLGYRLNGKDIAAAATCRFAVQPPFRGMSHLLVTSFFRQKDVDLFLNTTATVAAGKIMTALKATPLPQPEFGKVLFWVLRPGRFVKSVASKAGIHPLGRWLVLGAGASVLVAERVLKGRTPRSRRGSIEVRSISVSTLGAEYDKFWAAAESEPGKLHARRSRELFRWHFEAPDSQRKAEVIGCYLQGKLLGYALVRHDPPAADGSCRSLLADLMVSGDEDVIVERLISAAYRNSKSRGATVLEVMGFPTNIRRAMLRLRPYVREYPADPFFFKVRDKALQEILAAESAWYATPYDGDSTIWP